MLLVDAAYRCFDLACTDLARLSPNRATHLKSPENWISIVCLEKNIVWVTFINYSEDDHFEV